VIRFENKARLACAYGGLVWGVFWIPLRALDDSGISDVWATVVFYLFPFMALVPLIMYRWRYIIRGGWRLQLIGFFAGFSMVLYSNAFFYTEVVRAILLYYLCPIWGMLLARIFLKEKIIPIRILSICFGMAGMLVIFAADVGVPWPKYTGDWISLSSGIIWAIAMVLMRNDESNGAIELTTSYFIWGTIAAIIVAYLAFSRDFSTLEIGSLINSLPWLLPVLLIVVLPGIYAVMWGTPHLNPGIAGLLFMTEIIVGSSTAAILADEPFGLREITGIVLIILAGLTEIVGRSVTRLVRVLLPIEK
jgi:drug/metabolite transporter (DMT)-like permease